MALILLTGCRKEDGQALRIGIIDFYGLHEVSATQARGAIAFKEGDTVVVAGDTEPALFVESKRRLLMLPGVLNARLELVCCEGDDFILYVGIEERDRPISRFRSAPEGPVRLPADVVQAGTDFERAMTAAVQRGDAGEDDSKGHALMHDPAARAVQERFIEMARDLPRLRDVLRQSGDAAHRALAAQILGYAASKRDVIDDLVYGMTDASSTVRNNAMRALALIAGANPGSSPGIPIEPFVGLIHSLVWTDRNKAALALGRLSERRDPEMLATLRSRAMGPLVEMARWKSEGHARPAFEILGRIAGQSDEDANAAWRRGEREAVINAALQRR